MLVVLSDGPRCGDVLDPEDPAGEVVIYRGRVIFGYQGRELMYCYGKADYTTSSGMPVFEWWPLDPADLEPFVHV